MIVEFPQADSCCWKLDLRLGVIIIVVIRIILMVLVILFGTNVITLNELDKGNYYTESFIGSLFFLLDTDRTCDLALMRDVEIVLLTVTIVLLVLWLVLMIPGVIWEILPVILIGAVLEVVIWVWFFFLAAFHFALCILKGYISFLLLYAFVCLVLECYILWIMWSYYVEVKDLIREGRYRPQRQSTSTDS